MIDPLGEGLIQLASIDLRLGNDFRVFRNSSHVAIDSEVHQPDLTEHIVVSLEEGIHLAERFVSQP